MEDDAKEVLRLCLELNLALSHVKIEGGGPEAAVA